MTAASALKRVRKTLLNAGIEDAQLEARALTQAVLKIGSTAFLTDDSDIDERLLSELFKKAEKRADGYPLQYIIGEWEFFSLPFAVGEGVLVPRQDTEQLVLFAIEFLKEKPNAEVIDLCSGSGCIAISIAKHFPKAKVTAVEKSDRAFSYLLKNIEKNNVKVNAVLGDIAELETKKHYDLVVSNPPYIESDVLPTLQKEVKHEPAMALDGGNDGLSFYRLIAMRWLPKIKHGGALAVEIGYNQKAAVTEIFQKAGIENVRCIKDYGGNNRTIVGTVNSDCVE